MSTRKVGDFTLKSIGGLPTIAAVEVVPSADRMLLWDASAPEGQRTKAIHISQLPELVGAISSGITGLQFEITFSATDLSVAGVLPVVHNLNSYPSAIAVYAPNRDEVKPDRVEVVSTNAIAIYLGSFLPLSGVWVLSLTS